MVIGLTCVGAPGPAEGRRAQRLERLQVRLLGWLDGHGRHAGLRGRSRGTVCRGLCAVHELALDIAVGAGGAVQELGHTKEVRGAAMVRGAQGVVAGREVHVGGLQAVDGVCDVDEL